MHSTGRVIRDIEKKCTAPDEKLQNKLILACRIWKQQKESKGKIYSIYEPSVHGRPYDGHNFNGAMDQVKKLVGNMAKLIAAIFLPNFISHFLQKFV
ncbi:MAG: hypothetical protein KBD78_14665 [Oligoflexales bacterium]|nr:hypothetical protein [Oligoflexales bacterium]